MDVDRFGDMARLGSRNQRGSLRSLFKFSLLVNADSELVEGQQGLMNPCPELVRDLRGRSVNAGTTSARHCAAFCSCGVGTGKLIVALRPFLVLLKHLLHFSLLGDSSHLVLKFSFVHLHPICFLIWDVN